MSSDGTIKETAAGGADAIPEMVGEVTAAEAAELAEVFGEPDIEHQGDGTDTTDTATSESADDNDPVAVSAKREAAKYRRKLRDAETTVAQLTGRLETLQTAEVERIAGQYLTDPRDLWRDGGSLGQVLDEDGNVDRAKVAAAAAEILKAHPHWRRPEKVKPDIENLKPGHGLVADTSVSWAQVLAQ
jgi:hypothetical protein